MRRWEGEKGVRLRIAGCGLRIMIAVLCGVTAAGCGILTPRPPDESGLWRGMDVSVDLPVGEWKVEQVRGEEAVLFTGATDGVRIALMRVEAQDGGAAWVPLKNLFVHFMDKKEISRGKRPLPWGGEAEWGEYAVTEGGRTLRVKAYTFRRGAWVYDLAAWDFAGGEKAGKVAEGVLDAMKFEDGA